jgi:hypothetical protein
LIEEGSTMSNQSVTHTALPKYKYAFVRIFREDVNGGEYRHAAIIADNEEDGDDGRFVIRGEVVGYYHAEFAFSDTKIPLDGEIETAPAFPISEVCADHDLDHEDERELDPASPVATLRGSGSLANEQAAHRDIWDQAKEHLRELGYRECGYIDRAVIDLDTTSGYVYHLDQKSGHHPANRASIAQPLT